MKDGYDISTNSKTTNVGFIGSYNTNNILNIVSNTKLTKIHTDKSLNLKKSKVKLELFSNNPDKYDRDLYGEKKYLTINIIFDKNDDFLCTPIMDFIESRSDFKFDGFSDSDETVYTWSIEYGDGNIGNVKKEIKGIWKEVKKEFNLN